MVPNLPYPACQSEQVKRNGHIHNRKQNYQCKNCNRRFVAHATKNSISDQEKQLIDKLLLERLCLAGICRVMDVSKPWLMDYVAALLNSSYQHKDSILLEIFRGEADEVWPFVGNKANKQWVWMVMNTHNRQIIALHIGDRGIEDAWKLWKNIPAAFQEQATFFTDFWKAYNIIDHDQHHAAGKDKGFVNHLERFNGTLRQRCSRLVRQTLSFSKKQSNQLGAIKYFICHYNHQIAVHL